MAPRSPVNAPFGANVGTPARVSGAISDTEEHDEPNGGRGGRIARGGGSMKRSSPGRRQLLQMGAALGGSLLAGEKARAPETNPRKLGEPLGPYGERSPFEKAVRWRRDSKTPETGSSFTPIHDSVGTVTPSALHYERHHSGIPTIDPATHRLVIHGLVDRPLSLSMADIKRLASVTRALARERTEEPP